MGLAIAALLGLTLSDANGADQHAFLVNHCYDCHGDGSSKGGLAIDKLGDDLTDAETTRRWTLIHDRIKAGEMPPPKRDQPAADETRAYHHSLADTLTASHVKQREVVLRRLNRVEYENTVRDLFGTYVELKDLLPEEVSASGFDNVGEALASSDALIDGYLKAADATLDAVFGETKKPAAINTRFPLAQDVQNQIGKMFRKDADGVAVFSSGYCPTTVRSLKIRHESKLTYRVRIHAKGIQSDKPVTMSVHAGDVIVHRRPFFLVGFFDLPTDKMTAVEFTVRLGKYDTIHPKPYGTVGRPRDAKTYDGPGIVFGDIEVEGPLESWPPPSRATLLGEVKLSDGTIDDVRQIVLRLLPRAFRRAVKPNAADPYVALAKGALDAGRSFEDALRLAIKGVLVSPEFLFLDEPASAVKHERNKAIDNFSLASRLSYFLWSSMPDKALFDVARSGALSQPNELRKQVERMLADDKAKAFNENFTGQWLDLRDIDFTEPDQKLYPEFDEALKDAMLQETRLYFDRVLREDRPLLEFVDSNWTMLNERLAKHYGLEGVQGTKFRHVTLPKNATRGGVLTHASVLKVTANGTNTSPVTRGVWVLDNILGEPPPPPPPGVPAVEPDIRGATTLREQLAKHRNTERCASCHRKIDPPGFALESFDVIGGQRTFYRSLGVGERLNIYANPAAAYAHVRVAYRKGPAVDSTGELLDAGKFNDIREFKSMLLKQPRSIARGITRKLMVYALGRELGFSDRPEVQRIVEAIAKKDYGFRTLIHEVTQSESFRRY